MKYNLRFYWKTREKGDSYEHYSQSYIRNLSNIASYQLDRNKIEAELLRRNRQVPNFTFQTGISDLVLGLSEDKAHAVKFRVGSEQHEVRAT